MASSGTQEIISQSRAIILSTVAISKPKNNKRSAYRALLMDFIRPVLRRGVRIVPIDGTVGKPIFQSSENDVPCTLEVLKHLVPFLASSPTKVSQSNLNFTLAKRAELNHNPRALPLAHSRILRWRIPVEREHFQGKKAEYPQLLTF